MIHFTGISLNDFYLVTTPAEEANIYAYIKSRRIRIVYDIILIR